MFRNLLMTKTNKYFLILIFSTFPLTDLFEQTVVKSVQYNSSNIQQNTIYQKTFGDSLPKQISWTNDYEGLYSNKQKIVLDSLCEKLKNRTGIEIAILTIPTNYVSNEKFDDLTLNIAKTWSLGQKDKNNGILIGISAGYKKMRIQLGVGIEKLITENETKFIIDNYFIPEFKKGNYYQGTLSGLTELIDLLHEKLNWMTNNLPTTVGEFISFLGNYSEFIYNEDDITEPNGNLCVWKIENRLIINAGVELMGSENKPNNQDQIYFYELTAINNNIVENLIFDLTLNKSSLNECSQKFKLNKSNIDNTWKFKQNNIFTYLSFDTNGILIKIGQYTFDYDSVN